MRVLGVLNESRTFLVCVGGDHRQLLTWVQDADNHFAT